MALAKTNLELVEECDNFPYHDIDPDRYSELVSSYYKFCVGGDEELTVGWMLPWVVDRMNWSNDFLINSQTRTISFAHWKGIEKRVNSIVEDQLNRARESQAFEVLKGWRNELYPIVGLDTGLKMERAGSALFGIVTFGVHMTAYTQTEDRLKIWVPRRARMKQTYGGMLDNTVAGGISAGEVPFECLVREAAEEASLPEQVVRKEAKSCGTVSYFHMRDKRAGGEVGLLQPEVQYVYDIELPSDIVPTPCDSEVENFYLLTLEEVQEALTKGQFKPNCAVVLLDFLVRHGVLTVENEPGYVEIVSRMHRKLPFPTSLSKKSS